MTRFEEMLDNIDASVFSGDTLYDAEELASFKKYVVRWNREIAVKEKEAVEEFDEITDSPTGF